MSKERTGSCLCRKVTVTIKGAAIATNLCHCVNCQKAAGSVFYAGARFNAEDVSYDDPESVVKAYVDGNTALKSGISRSFCSQCGSLVKIYSIGFPQYVSVPVGLVDGDDRADLKPATEFFCARRVDWFSGVEGSRRFETMPQS